MHTDCCLCDLFRIPNPLEPWDTALLRVNNYVVVPSKGALVPGWSLVVPSGHALCVGAVDAAKRLELMSVAHAVRKATSELFGNATVFEHGPSSPCHAVGCGIDHVHLHVVPLSFSLFAATRKEIPSAEWHLVDDRPDELLAEVHSRGEDYIYIDEPDRETMVGILACPISQAIRKVIAKQIGQAHAWDYREHPFADNVASTIRAWRTVKPSCT